jgi:hypothetical protein
MWFDRAIVPNAFNDILKYLATLCEYLLNHNWEGQLLLWGLVWPSSPRDTKQFIGELSPLEHRAHHLLSSSHQSLRAGSSWLCGWSPDFCFPLSYVPQGPLVLQSYAPLKAKKGHFKNGQMAPDLHRFYSQVLDSTMIRKKYAFNRNHTLNFEFGVFPRLVACSSIFFLDA